MRTILCLQLGVGIPIGVVAAIVMASAQELGKGPVDQPYLSRPPDELLVNEAGGVVLVFDALEEEGMLADLAEAAELHAIPAETIDTRQFA